MPLSSDDLLDRTPVADDFDLQRADHIADKSDAIHRRARRNQRRGHGEKCVTRADRIDHVFGKCRNGMDDAAALESYATVLALRDNDLRAVDVAPRPGGARCRRRLKHGR